MITDQTARELIEALRQAEDALASCYQVCDYPANGRSTQDHALAVVRTALTRAQKEMGDG